MKQIPKKDYTEVRYAKNISFRLKHSYPVFPLSRNWKYLELKEYAETSKTCPGTAKSVKYLTMSDLTGAISEKVGGSVANDVEDENNIEKPGEHNCCLFGLKMK